jgi:hypothetical protein
VEPDGTGRTLVLRSPLGLSDHTLAENWRASAAPGGSPGTDDLYTYALWSSQFPGIGDATANPDGDELSNKLEYAFAGDPNTAGPAPVTGALQNFPAAAPPGEYLTITFTRRADAGDLTFTPQFSADLNIWFPAPTRVATTTNPNGTVTETWRSSMPVNATGRMFVRVQVD